MSIAHGLETLWFSARQAARSLRRSPLFALPVILCVALVIAANSTVFSVVDALLLRAVPFDEPDRLVALGSLHSAPGTDPQELSVSPQDFVAWREQADVFSKMASVYPRNFNLAATSAEGTLGGGVAEPERVQGALVSPAFFDVLRVRPAQGRAFSPEEEQAGRESVAILSDRLWRRRFSADPGIVGKVFLVDGEATRVVGVMPAGFRYPGDGEIWLPQRFEPASPTHKWHYLRPVARLAPGVSVDRARREMVQIASRLEEELPDTNRGWSATVEPLADNLVGDIKPRLLALAAGVGFLLLVACANIANLLLARGTARSREMAVRTAMGSSKLRLVFQSLLEGVLLALAGGAIGLVLTRLATGFIARAPLDIPALSDVSLDLRAIAFTLLVAVVTGVVFSLAPALRLLALAPQRFLTDGTRGTQGTRGLYLQGLFVVLQVAITLVLLTSAALLLRSFHALESVDPGFDPSDLLTFRVSLPESRYPGTTERNLFADQMVDRLAHMPGVRSAALTTALPIADRDVAFSATFSVEGRPPRDEGSKYVASIRRVTPGYFETLGIRRLAGRVFTAADRADTQGVVVVSRSMADQYWPGESPVGKRIKPGEYDSPEPWLTVVGMVEDIKDDGLQGEVKPIWYRPYSQHESKSSRYVAFLVRTDADPTALIQPVGREVRAMDRLLPLYDVATMRQVMADSLAQNQVMAAVFGALSILGLVIAAIGLYGVMSYVVNQRLQEIGIRMAMGADRGDVVGLVLKRGMILTGLGAALGFFGMVLLARPISSLLFGVQAMDLVTFGGVALGLGFVALLANLLPARRATRVDPLTPLREG